MSGGTHGKWWTYSGGCRCEDCRYAWAIHSRLRPELAEDMCPRCGRWYQALAIHDTKCAQRERTTEVMGKTRPNVPKGKRGLGASDPQVLLETIA